MKKLLAIFAVVVLMGQGCGGNTTEQQQKTPSEPTQESQRVEPEVDEQPVEEMDEPPVEGIKDVPDNQPGDATGAGSTIGTESEPLEIDVDTPTQADTTPQEADDQAEPNIDEQPVEEMDEPPVEGVKNDNQTGQNTDTETETEARPKTVDMKSGNYFFEPATITAKAGQKVTLTFSENDGFHTFVIDEIDFKTQVAKDKTVTFTVPDQPGSYAFYCDVGNHRAAGMEGVLIVE